jgi:hypothetical protein
LVLEKDWASIKFNSKEEKTLKERKRENKPRQMERIAM